MRPPRVPSRGKVYIRAAALGNMNSQIQIVRPTEPIYDPTTGFAIGTRAAEGYTGRAHIHPAVPGADVYAGEALEGVTTIPVSIPWNATPVPNDEDQVVVLDDEDPGLIGKTLRITDANGSGIGFPVRMLTCTFVDPTPFNPGA